MSDAAKEIFLVAFIIVLIIICANKENKIEELKSNLSTMEIQKLTCQYEIEKSKK